MNTTYPKTLQAVSDELGIPVRTLRWHVHVKKDLRAFKLGNLTFIDPQEVERFAAAYVKSAR